MTHTYCMTLSCALADACARYEDDAGKHLLTRTYADFSEELISKPVIMSMVIRSARMVATVLSVAFLAGCAFGTRQPTLIYPPASESGNKSVAHAAITPIQKNVQIVLKPFVDQRSDKKTVGTVRNALGMRTADVIPTNDVSDWVAQAVATELRNNGYTVINSTGQAGNTGKVVSGDILNVFCDMYFSYTGQVSLVVRVNEDGKELLNKHYAGEGSAGMAVAMTAESYAQSLALALSSALQQFVADLNKNIPAQ